MGFGGPWWFVGRGEAEFVGGAGWRPVDGSVALAGRVCSAGEGVADALVAGDGFCCPGPVGVEVEDELAGSGGGLAGDVEDPGAERVGFGFGEVAVEADELDPGDEGEVQPRFVGGGVPVGLAEGAGGLPGADAVLDAGVLTLAQLESGDVWVWAVGEEQGVAASLHLVEQ